MAQQTESLAFPANIFQKLTLVVEIYLSDDFLYSMAQGPVAQGPCG